MVFRFNKRSARLSRNAKENAQNREYKHIPAPEKQKYILAITQHTLSFLLSPLALILASQIWNFISKKIRIYLNDDSNWNYSQYMYALCVSGAVNTQGFVWKFFMCYI